MLDRVRGDRQNQQGFVQRLEAADTFALGSKPPHNGLGSGVADIEPDDLRREPLDVAALTKVRILGNDAKLYARA